MNATSHVIMVKGTSSIAINRLRWVARAKSTDDVRAGMMGVFAEKDGEEIRITSTDGRRLHTCTITAGIVPEGNWNITDSKGMITLVENTETFPNWRKVIPENREHVAGEYDAYPWRKGDYAGKGSTSSEIMKLARYTDCNFNLQYLFDIAGEKTELLTFSVEMVEKPTDENRDTKVIMSYSDIVRDPRKQAVVFLAKDGRQAVIMPMMG